MNDNALVKVKGLKKYFPLQKGFFKRTRGDVKAVDDISFYIEEGEILGLVGESGCGKTTAGRAILRAIEPTAGEILFKKDKAEFINLVSLNKDELRHMRRYMQMVFQDPYGSLNPRMTVRGIIGEPLLVNGVARGKELEHRVGELMKAVGLRPEYMIRYPHAFSGGQRQRIGIARAIALNPRLIVCDEPVSALDVSVQAQILNLLQDLQDQFHLTMLFVAHDIGVIEHISDRVMVMYVGKLVEMAETEKLFKNPQHPYTEALLFSVPKPDPKYRESRKIIVGELPDPANPPSGCYFHPRCKYVQAICEEEFPPWEEVAPEHFAACHFAKKLHLHGVI